MPKLVDVEDVGLVEFEDDATPQEIDSAIRNDILPRYQQKQQVIRATPVEGGSFQAGGLNGAPVVPAGGAPDPQAAQDPSFFRSAADATQRATYGGLAGLARVFQGAIPENATAPMDVATRNFLGGAAEKLTGLSREATEYYGVDPQAKDLRSQIGRGVGTFTAAGPLLATGGVAGLAAGAGQMGATTYNEAFQAAKEEGKTDAEAQDKAVGEAAKTLPQLAAYMIGGKIAGAAAGKLAEAAGPALKGLVGAGAATASNMAVGTITRALEGQDWKPTAENLTMDALFGMLHGYGEFAGASKEVRARAAEELRDRGLPEEIVAPVEVQGRSTPTPEEKTPPAAPQEASGPVPEVVVPEAEIKVTPEGVTDLATGEPISPVREQSLKSLGQIPEVREETALIPVERDAFERISGETLEEGNVAYQDPQTRQVFQVPEKATPEELKGIVDAARQEEASAQERARKEELDARLQDIFLRESREGFGSTEAVKEAPVPKPVEVQQNDYLWNNPVRLRNLKEEMMAQDKKAKAGTLSIGGEKVRPNPRFEATIKEIDSRIEYLMSDRAVEEAPREFAPIKVAPPEEPVLPQERANEPSPEVSGRQIEPPVIESTPVPEGQLPPNATSIKNAVVNQERAARELPPLPVGESVSMQSIWDEARRRVAEDPDYQGRLIASLEETGRAADPYEQAVVFNRQVELQNAYDRELQRANSAREAGNLDEAQAADVNRRAIKDEYEKVTNLGKVVGTTSSLSMRFRQEMVDRDFSLLRMEQEFEAEKGAPLNAKEAEFVKTTAKKIQKTDQAAQEREARAEEIRASEEYQKAHKKLVSRVGAEKAPPKAKVNEWLRNKAEEARARIQARREQGQAFSGGINPEVIDDYIVIGASKIADGIGNFAQWSKDMLTEFGEAIRPHLKTIFDKAGAAVKTAPKVATNEEQRTRIVEGMKARVADGATVNELGRYIQGLAENAVRGGVKDRETLVKSVHEFVKPLLPDVTPREIQDAISGYGKFTPLSKDEVNTTLRDLKGQLQQVSKIEDLQKKIAPRKTGQERREKSVEERRLERMVNELKKKGGYNVTDPEKQLKSSIAAQERSLSNAIRDLAEEIDLGQPEPKRGAPPTNEKIEGLKALLARMRQTREELYGAKTREMTDEQRVRNAIQAAERMTAEYERQVQQEDFARKKGKPLLSTPELEAARKRRDAARAERDELKALADEIANPKLTPDQRYLKAVKARLKTETAKLQERLAKGDFEPRKKREVPPDNELLKLRVENSKAKEDYLKALFDVRMKNRPVWKKIIGGVGEAANTSRAVLTGFDVSAPLRQGGFITFGNPARTARALKPMFLALGLTPKSGLAAMKAAGKQLISGNPLTAPFRSAIDAVKTVGAYGDLMSNLTMEEIRSRPNYHLAQGAKLFLSDNHSPSLTKMEEAFAGRWAQKIPGVAASARAYGTFLNRLRMDTFDAMLESLKKSGTPTPEEAKAIANFVNVATGRGSIPGGWEQAAAGLNMAFFAPRHAISRFQVLLGQPLYGGTARTRKLIAGQYARTLAGLGLVYGLANMAGVKIGTDPTSSDFLKLIFGNQRLDLMFGLIQPTVLLSRFWTGKTTGTNGKVHELNKEKGPFAPTYGSVGTRFLRTKLAPLPGSTYSLATGTDLVGNKFGWKDWVKANTVPISFGDIYTAMKEQGIPGGSALGLTSMFGAGLQNQDEKKATGKPKDIFRSREKRDIFAK